MAQRSLSDNLARAARAQMEWIDDAQEPGDVVRLRRYQRRDALGEVEVRQYGDKFRVAIFAPGVTIQFPGDTPKTEPEHSDWETTLKAAKETFDLYCFIMIEEGWQESRSC